MPKFPITGSHNTEKPAKNMDEDGGFKKNHDSPLQYAVIQTKILTLNSSGSGNNEPLSILFIPR